MNFIVSSASLLRSLQSISGVLNTSNNLPILDNFLFEIVDGKLTVSATDIETTIHTTLEVESKEDGKICIDAKKLLEILKSFSDHPLNFSVNLSNFAVEMTSDYGKYKLVGANAEEFPKNPTLSGATSIKIPGEVVVTAINKTLFATGNDDLRPVMSGVFCEFSDKDLTFVATDAHKLIRYKRTDASGSGSSAFILPKKPLNILKANIKDEEEVQIEYNESNAVFRYGDTELVCRLIDGKYPNYEAVIPNENPNKLTIDRVSLLTSIKRVSIFANKSTNQVKLKMAGSELTISAEDLDFSNEASERLTCVYDGDDMEIGFNSRFIIEMLQNLETDNVIIEMSEPNRAGIILPAESSENEDILMLVMPVMLNR
ncbi:MAG: DNA polymerase III subunit beta [Crocinitomicaceae bacterium]|nr:DNA polymerase III subunit beta [Crocinitomicaceae bacterium]